MSRLLGWINKVKIISFYLCTFLKSLRTAVMVYWAVFLLSAHCFLLTYLMLPVTFVSAVLLLRMWYSGTVMGPEICAWFSPLQLVCIKVPWGHICNIKIKVLSLCLKSCLRGTRLPNGYVLLISWGQSLSC